MDRRAEARRAITDLLRSTGAKPGAAVRMSAIGTFLVPHGFGRGELTEALLLFLRDDIVDLIPGTNTLRLLERP
jgi:hypothetical protein